MILPSDDPITAALKYVATGWPVFPVYSIDDKGRCTCGKNCDRDAGKHPRTRNGLHAATTNPETIKTWWDQWPEANIGLATGADSGVFVIDIDADHGGWESADRLEAEHGAFPPTRVVRTGGGVHVYLYYPVHGSISNSAGKLAPGLDVRGQGGYALLPPSLHRSGHRYAWDWLDGPEGPSADAIAVAPGWLLNLLAEPPASRPGNTHRGARSLSDGPIAEGARNSTLTSMAGSMRRAGFSGAEMRNALLRVNAERCRPPLPDSEVARIARSIERYPPTVRVGRPPRFDLVGGKVVTG
jgi:putative DNA primase/helicase